MQECFVFWLKSVRIPCPLKTREGIHGFGGVTRVSPWDGAWAEMGTFALQANRLFNLVSEQAFDQYCCRLSITFSFFSAEPVRWGFFLPRSVCQHLIYSQKLDIWPITIQEAHCDNDKKNKRKQHYFTEVSTDRHSIDPWIWESIFKQFGFAAGCVDISLLTDAAPLTDSWAEGAESPPCFLSLKRSLMLLSDNSLPAASRRLFWSQLSEWWGWLRLEQWAPFVLLKGDRKHWFQPFPGL